MEAASLMTTTAVDLGAPGFDPEYGYGRVDALAATGGARRRRSGAASTGSSGRTRSPRLSPSPRRRMVQR